MTSTTYRKLTYEELRNLAYDFLNEYTDGQLPINLVSIIDKINNLHLLKYTTFAKQHNLSMSEVIAFLQSDDGALWYQYSTDTYILLYNNTIASKERIRFTIAHELGHYVLRHNEITDKTIISRYTLTNSEYNEFEREANFFGKHLLVPFPILGDYIQFFHTVDTQFIQQIFYVSYSVATYVIENLKSMQSIGLVKINHYVEERFASYITKDQTTRICYNCHASILRTVSYCPYCQTPHNKGKNDISLFLAKKEAEKEEMKYSSITLNDKGFPLKCPRCDNEDIKSTDKYCSVCATYLHNICIGYGPFDESPYAPYPTFEPYKETNGCGKSLPGYARYCPDCGGISSYFNQELLSYWENEKETEKLS